uniref:Uncharacterized protein n=1 Tax=Meleagris gallopavo TaxID=9103 RepID=A0A803XQ60_MELGA
NQPQHQTLEHPGETPRGGIQHRGSRRPRPNAAMMFGFSPRVERRCRGQRPNGARGTSHRARLAPAGSETGGGHHRDGMLYLGARASLADALPLHIAPRWFSSHSGECRSPGPFPANPWFLPRGSRGGWCEDAGARALGLEDWLELLVLLLEL